MSGMCKISTRGAHNLRDLGGYPAADGKRVKMGLAFRSDDLSELDEDDLDTLTPLGIRTVIDFRTRQEASYLPDVLPASVVRTEAIPIDAGKLIGAFPGGSLNRRKLMGVMVSVYRQLVADFVPSFRRFFELVSDTDNAPLLFHCTAGKDRTGVAAALLLSALGVSRKLVIEDYVYSAECLKTKYVSGRDYDEVMQPLYTVYPEFIETAFETIDARFGGIDRYLVNEMGVDCEALRRFYTA